MLIKNDNVDDYAIRNKCIFILLDYITENFVVNLKMCDSLKHQRSFFFLVSACFLLL